MDSIRFGGQALAMTALVTGAGAWGLNQLGLAKKVMRTAAPHFIDACKYGAVRGVVTFMIAAASIELQKKNQENWVKGAIAVGALAALAVSVPYTRQLTKDLLGVKISEQFTYLALLAEFGSIYASANR
ncbi:MAG: hypothetical protein H7A38_04865 [Chlamydiales bacterium]|nr:hypothetical protein [Chlamydiales bacterium]